MNRETQDNGKQRGQDNAVLIYADGIAWLQVRDGQGIARVSYLGRLNWESLLSFAASRGIKVLRSSF